jgi:hypothetical protein
MKSIKPEEFIPGQYYVVDTRHGTSGGSDFIFRFEGPIDRKKHTGKDPYIGGHKGRCSLDKADMLNYCKDNYKHTRLATWEERCWLDQSIQAGRSLYLCDVEIKPETYEIF